MAARRACAASDDADDWLFASRRSRCVLTPSCQFSARPFSEPETASPEKPTILHRDGVRIERIDRLGLELGTQYKSEYRVEDNDPLSAVAELHNIQTLSLNEWQIRIETQLRLSATGNAFLLQGSMRAFEGANEVCRHDWDRSIPRDFL